MLEKITIARPYARAVFELATEQQALKSWSGLLQTLALVVADEQMSWLLHSPKVSSEELYDIVSSITGKLSDTQQRFVRLLIDGSRLQYAPEIAKLFEDSRRDAEGLVRVDVISAHALEDSQRDRISGAMAKRLDRQIELSEETDEKLIGGAVIRYGDSVIDASIRGQIEILRNQLL